jgi:hypothetical protein
MRHLKTSVVGINGGKTAPPGTTKECTVAYLGKCVATASKKKRK